MDNFIIIVFILILFFFFILILFQKKKNALPETLPFFLHQKSALFTKRRVA